jgi:protein translocase SecG subunit
MDAIKTLLTIIQIISCVLLIGIVMTQATKSEWLSGTIGGKSESAFRGKPGTEEKIRQYTKWLAIGFFVISAVLAVVNSKMPV